MPNNLTVDVGKLTLYQAVLLLEKWREEGVRTPELLLDIWHTVLESKIDKTEEEKWLIYEQVYIAALDCADMALASKCAYALEKKFKNGQRLLRLRAMSLEANGMLNEALQTYDALIAIDPINPLNYKRKVTVLTCMGRLNDAIHHLCEYLSKFLNDHEAWVELGQLYLRIHDFSRALFCIEEMILSKPLTYAFHMLYAEVKCTQGGMENLDLAKLYYCQALKLKPQCARAAWGLYICCMQIIPKTAGQKRREYANLLRWVSGTLLSLYSAQPCWEHSGRALLFKPIRLLLKGAKMVDY